MKCFNLARISIAACGAAFAVLAQGQAYPSKPIRMVMPYSAGQSTDISGRILASFMSEGLGQPVIVENRQGADGVVGTSYVAKSPPDGYTILVGTSAQFGAANVLFKDLPYDPVKEFAPISRLFSVFYILTVGGGHAASSIGDFISLAKQNPGKLTIANTSGIGYLTGELFKQAAGIDVLDIAHKTNAQAIADLATGRVDAMFISPAAAMPQIRSGKFKALGITLSKRSVLTPGIPTIAESGFPGFESNPSPALFAPARTPRDIITRLNAETVSALRDPKAKAIFAKNGTTEAEIVGSTPEELAAFVKSEIDMWARAAKQGLRSRD